MIIAGDNMTATKLNISIEQGAKFERNILVRNNNGTSKDLTGYSARMQVRPTFASSTILLEATTANGLISINGPGGIVTISISADITTPLDWSVAVYDLEIYINATEIIRILEGSASLSLEVTR
jgi:hypothetical protein